MRQYAWLSALLLSGLLLSHAVGGDDKIDYPKTKRVNHVDDYHGEQVADPYRWLEADVRTSKEVADWVAAENKVTDAYLKGIPERPAIKQRLTELWNYEKYTAPKKVGTRYVFSKNDGLQNQSVLYIQDTLDSTPRVLLDPNKWSKDGTVALAGTSFSEDGKYAAYGVSDAGSDWSVWHVLNVDTGKKLDDELRWLKYGGGATWTHDGRGFFYSRFPEPKPGEKYQALPFNQKVYYHRLGTPQSEDVLVYHRPDHPSWGCGAGVTEDGRYLILIISDGTTSRKSRIAYKDLQDPYGLPVDLIDQHDAVYNFIDNDGPVFYFKTDQGAPKGRVVAIDTRHPDRKDWKTVIPEAEPTLQGVNVVGNLFVASYLKDAYTQVKLFAPDGTFVREVEFPGIGTASGFGGKRSDTETFYSFSSFTTPPTIYRYNTITGKGTVFRQSKVKFIPDDYAVKQSFYESKDGTRVPMFLSHKKDLKLDGNNPTLLYGYGGFNISMTPGFDAAKLAWMELGGVYVVANIRGGGEYGQAWHRAATRLNRPKAYDDFIAAAEWLVANKYTQPAKLAIQGGSNGGLLVGAAMTRRPDLFGACLPAVGVMDMLRFHKFTAGRFWVDDYGSSDDPEEFNVLRSYSPYHNLKKGTQYPATLVTTADTDDRVVPSHSFKFIAELQYDQGGPAPVLARIETRAGHGAGRPTSQKIEEVADQWAFLVRNLKMRLPAAAH
jgi:prolyl oligopeptidase